VLFGVNVWGLWFRVRVHGLGLGSRVERLRSGFRVYVEGLGFSAMLKINSLLYYLHAKADVNHQIM
jgi:hypothetical protein